MLKIKYVKICRLCNVANGPISVKNINIVKKYLWIRNLRLKGKENVIKSMEMALRWGKIFKIRWKNFCNIP